VNSAELNTQNSTLKTASGFWPLIVTQFQGAFSDNVVKNLVVFVALFAAGGGALTAAEKHAFGEWIGALFALPFILFSVAGGFLADRFSKRSVMLGVKVFELGIMAVVFAGLWTMDKKLLLASVFLMGTHSAIFGPAKYGSLPELLPDKKLSWGNGVLELGTFMAIILGTVAAAFMASIMNTSREVSQLWPGMFLLALAVIGLAACRHIAKVPAANPANQFNVNFVGEVWRSLRKMRGDRPLWLAVIGNTYFSFIGALLLLNLFFYGADVLHVGETHIGLLNVALALGIGLGSVAAGYLSGGKIEYGLVPLGAVGLSLFCSLLAWPGLPLNAVFVLLALLGFAGGFFIVPIAALLQHKPSRETKGEVQATANLLSFVGVFLASGAHWLLAQHFALTPRGIFLVGGLLTLAGAIYVLILLPSALLRFVLWAVTHSVYRIHVVGRENIPAKSGALFVCNHVSWVDAVLLIASTDRNVRFLMFKDLYEHRWLNPFYKILGVIPISAEQRPRELIKSLQAASDAIRAGEVACIFAEGEITRIGQMLPFRRGMERIMKNVDAPIIPVALDGVLGSPGSFKGGKFIWRVPERMPHPVTVSFGKPLPASATPFEVRQAVQELLADAWPQRRERMLPLQRAFVRTCRQHPRRFAMSDGQGEGAMFGDALTRTIFLARRLKQVWNAQEMVGLLLPPSVAGALVNHAALLCGKVPVNLNYTLSADALASCAKQCGITTVITSRAFLEKVKLTVPGEVIYLEDMAANPSLGEKVFAWFMATLSPVGLLECALGNTNKTSLDDLVTVIFSSGSTGEPKGVMLSHYNVGANVEQLGQVFALDGDDRILGILPFFHSFGFTGTFALPAVLGTGVVFHPNPLDSRAIGPIVHHRQVTFLLATPTFLQFYLRGCGAGDFGSLRFVMTGAEKLPDRLATVFEEKFGVRPLEGYGATECAPAVAVNGPDFRAAGFHQIGGKRGKIGHPLPGVCVKIVDAENPRSGKTLPVGESGMLLVRGPNVMCGYLGQPAKTAEVLVEDFGVRGHDRALELGDMSPSSKAATCRRSPNDVAPRVWYITGDIAALDEDGFLQITGRLNRFSKIGGEMVPHVKVEEKLHEVAGLTEQTFVVAGVPDEKKGERLVVLVLKKFGDAELTAALGKIGACELPNLWKPKGDAFYRVDSFPLLGTGKLDLRAVKEVAQQLSATDEHR
jgi:acyl-[acyl-carrier-protein]-phospholipid O-acyltransferase/long-chain-fatty-acid--[acyl-carrier-protein] ligase